MNGNKLRKLREQQGLLQKELGERLNISASTIGMYEQGRRQPDFDTIKNIANYFEVSVDYLIDNETNNNYNEAEIKERAIIAKFLIDAGYMNNGDDLSDEELERIMKFVKNNKDFIKNSKKNET